jgi:Zn-dependent protease with chaperone function
MSSFAVTIPQRRSLLLFVILAMFMVLVSYVLILLLAAVCVLVPWLAVSSAANFVTLGLFLGGLVVAGIMLWSLVPRRDNFKAPGLLLEPASHPRLFAELENIANSLREPLPREVYLIGDPNAWVADRGGLMGIGSRRVMGLGWPLLAALNVSQFRAVLAHEFAHYYGGDTSLGPWLRRTQVVMVRTFQGIGSVGQMRLPAVVAIMYAIVFEILKWYSLLFLRAIHFVSRRQEYRADELACILAGPQSLASGLRLLHGISMAWPAYWKTEVAPTLELGCLPSITAGFSQFLTAPTVAKQVQSGIEKEIREGKANPYDSHPPLRDRLAAAEALAVQSQPDHPNPASGLLNDVDSEELRFLRAANPGMPTNSLKRVSWEELGSKVLIPSWANSVAEYASLLQGITAENLPEALGRIPHIAPHIRDPKGMLLRPEQRVERARLLLSAAFGLALVDHGWTVHSRPGNFHLDHGANQLHPHKLVLQLSDGAISKEAWATRCKEMGITGIPIAAAAKNDNVVRQANLPGAV